MADRVRFILDRMASLFKQMEDSTLFSKDEVKSIVKRTTDFEYVLRRRELKIDDFMGYLQYEFNLDKLRAVRSAKFLIDKSRKEGEAGDYKAKRGIVRMICSAFIGHINYIFERALRRFSNSMGLWDEFIFFLKSKDSNALLNTAFGRALSLHPKNEDMWVQAAFHELEKNNNSHAARVLLQRSLRVNKASKTLWFRYFEFEVWNGARIGDRKRLLELEVDNAALLGVPIVVLNHALVAVPDVSFAIDVHRSILGISDALVMKVEEVIKSHFNNRREWWAYVISLALKPSHNKTSQLLETLTSSHTAVINNSKRLFQNLSKSSSNSSQSDFITRSTDLIRNALNMLGGATTAMTPANAAADRAGSDLEGETSRNLLVVQVLNLCALRLFNDISSTTSTSSAEEEGEGRVAKRSKKMTATTPTLSAHAGFTREDIILVETLITEMLNLLNSHSSDHESSYCAEFLSTAGIVRHRLWQVLSALDRVEHFLSASGNELEAKVPTEYNISRSVISAKSLPVILAVEMGKLLLVIKNSSGVLGGKVGGAFSISGQFSTDFNKKIEDWCQFANYSLDSAKRLWCFTSAVEEENLVLEVCAAMKGGVALLPYCDTGLDCMASLLDTLTSLGRYSDCHDILKAAISSKYCKVGLRAAFSCKYLRFAIMVPSSAPELTSAAGGADALATSSESGRERMISAFDGIMKVFNEQPHLIVHEDFEPLFRIVISMERSFLEFEKFSNNGVSSSSAQMSNSFDFLRRVLDMATKSCANVGEFWDIYEATERELGNFKLAGHIKWRQDRLV